MLDTFSKYIGLPKKFVGTTLYGQDRSVYYNKIEIPKRNGKVRVLHAVSGKLKYLQTKTYEKLSSDFQPSTFAKAFVKGGGIIEHAKIHRNKKLIISFDIKDFFPSITFARVQGMFKKYPFSFDGNWATYLAQICCLENNGPIPQGGVTSPYVSNMLCRKMDSRFSKLAIKEKLHYSRYADDLTFSSNKFINIEKIKKWVEEVVNDEGFHLNHDKTRVLKKHQRQIVTGIVVNNGLNVNRKYINNTKALIYNCTRDGVKKHLVKKKDFKDKRNTCSPMFKVENNTYISYRAGLLSLKEAKYRFMCHILGRLNHIRHVAYSNEKLNSDHFERRKQIYIKLLKKFNIMRKNEKIEGVIGAKVNKELANYALQQNVEDVKDYSLDQLDHLVVEKAKTDPRFFATAFLSADLKTYRSQVQSFLKFYPVDHKKIISMFDQLTDSSSNTLGMIFHNGVINVKKFSKQRNYYKTHIRLYLPMKLREEFDDFFDEINYVVQESTSVELNFKESQKLIDIVSPCKKNTRFGKNPEDSKQLKNELEIIEKDLHERFLKDTKNNKVKFEYKIEAHSTYTHAPSLIDGLKTILESLYKNNTRRVNGVITVKSQYVENKKNDILIQLSDNNMDAKLDKIDRSFAHGKIKNSVFYLNGLFDYSICAKFKEKFYEINMMQEEESLVKMDHKNGFTHTLKTKS